MRGAEHTTPRAPLEVRWPLDDVVDEARRLLRVAWERDVELHVLGGVAVELVRPRSRPALLPREYKDIDVVARKGDGRAVGALLTGEGYEADEAFNAMHGRRRLLFHDRAHGRQVDVFIEHFEMCHVIPIADRVTPRAETIPVAELLATKLQIVELNEKDQRDVFNLLDAHEVVLDDSESADQLSARRLAELCAADWGLWRTCRQNLERARDALDGYGFPAAVRQRLSDRLERLWHEIEAEPKPRKWRLRARVGDRVRWYELPDEVR